MPGELARDDGLSAKQELMRVMRSTLDRLQQEMVKRFTRLKDLNANFGFYSARYISWKLSTKIILMPLCQNCNDLATVYHTDFDGSGCRILIRTRHDSEPTTPLELLSVIVTYGEDVFPNLRVALHILATISIADFALLSLERETVEQISTLIR